MIIKDDLLAVVNCVHSLRGQNCHLINMANIALLPKRNGAQEASDFRPISLMHSFPKLVSRMMASRLALEVHWLVTNNQSAFIRG